MIGRQLSRNTVPGGLLPFLFSSSQTAYSRLWKMYFAFGKVGTQRPSRSVVFQPQWSICRWVQNTKSILSKEIPSANSSLRQRSLPGKSNGGGCPLFSPVQVSTRMGYFGGRTTKVWYVMFIRPSAVS